VPDPAVTPLSCPAVLAGLDNRILYAMRTRCHGPAIEAIAKALGQVGEYGAIWLVLGIVLALVDSERRGEWLLCGLLGPFAIGVNYAVKLVVRRPRPVLEGLPPLSGAPSSLSFPSAHATSSFALAAAIAVGRPYLGMHYPSDVVAGAALGTALGLLVPLDLLS
jgi:membrane-associated phospholipid phosphatase